MLALLQIHAKYPPIEYTVWLSSHTQIFGYKTFYWIDFRKRVIVSFVSLHTPSAHTYAPIDMFSQNYPLTSSRNDLLNQPNENKHKKTSSSAPFPLLFLCISKKKFSVVGLHSSQEFQPEESHASKFTVCKNPLHYTQVND